MLKYQVLWPWLDIDELPEATIKSWMLHLAWFHFYVPAGHDLVCASLEMYVRASVGSVFEGAA